MTAQQHEEAQPAAETPDGSTEGAGAEDGSTAGDTEDAEVGIGDAGDDLGEFDADEALKNGGVNTTDEGFGADVLARVPGLIDRNKYQVPHGYKVSSTGVWQTIVLKDRDVTVPVTWAPVLVSKLLTDPDGNQFVELVWKDRARIVAAIVSRAIIRSGRKLVSALGGFGFPAVDSDAKLVEKWLAALEATNWEAIPEFPIARHLGWQPDGTFLSSGGDGRTIEPAYREQGRALAAQHARGTLDGWKQAVAVAESFPHVRAGIAAGLAAPLLRVFGMHSFTLDFSAPSSGGKSTTSGGTASVFGNPTTDGGSVFNWRTGMISIEKRLNLVRGMAVVIDETMAAKYESLIDDVLYQVPMDQGTARGGDYPSELPWNAIVVTTGERSILTYTKHQGASARVLEVHGAPFGDDGREAAEVFQRGVEENYGVAGPAFMAWLLPKLADKGWVAGVKSRLEELRSHLLGGNKLSSRRSPMVAVLALGEELAYEAGLLPYKPLPADGWRDLLVQQGESDDRPEMALDVVRSYMASHPNEFLGSPDAQHTPVRGWTGEYKRERGANGRQYLAILTDRLEDILAAKGYSLDAVAEQWVKADVVKVGKNQRPAWKVTARIGGNAGPKCVAFWRDKFEVIPDDEQPEERCDAPSDAGAPRCDAPSGTEFSQVALGVEGVVTQ